MTYDPNDDVGDHEFRGPGPGEMAGSAPALVVKPATLPEPAALKAGRLRAQRRQRMLNAEIERAGVDMEDAVSRRRK